MDVSEEKASPPTSGQVSEHPPKLPEAWQRLLDAIRRHYEKSPEQ